MKDNNNIQFQITTEQSICVKSKLETLLLGNSLDVILIFMEQNTINIIFVSQDYNNYIIEKPTLYYSIKIHLFHILTFKSIIYKNL
jgi:hypothetical protein